MKIPWFPHGFDQLPQFLALRPGPSPPRRLALAAAPRTTGRHAVRLEQRVAGPVPVVAELLGGVSTQKKRALGRVKMLVHAIIFW